MGVCDVYFSLAGVFVYETSCDSKLFFFFFNYQFLLCAQQILRLFMMFHIMLSNYLTTYCRAGMVPMNLRKNCCMPS